MKQKAVIYCRVSSKEQDETGFSLSAQERLLKEYAERKELNVVKVYSVAESASGAKQRQIFTEMLKFVAKEKINNILCEKVDRLTRNLKDAILVGDWVDSEEGRKLHFVKQNLVIENGSKSDDKFRWDIEVVLARKYINNLSEEVKKGQKEKIAQGWFPSRSPLGYKTIGDQGHKIHVIDEDTAPFIKKAFEYYASGNYSITGLSAKLYEEGLRGRFGHKVSKSALEVILKNPFYRGYIVWNGNTYTNAKHEPIVSSELFERVQRALSRGSAPAYGKHRFAFSKLINCEECGGTISIELQKGSTYLSCKHRGACSQRGCVREEVIEEQILQAFEIFSFLTEEEVKKIQEAVLGNYKGEVEYRTRNLKSLQARENALQKHLDVLYEDRLEGKIEKEFWEKKKRVIEDERTLVREQIEKFEGSTEQEYTKAINVLDLARNAKSIYLNKNRTPEEKRQLINLMFETIELNGQEITYTLAGPFDMISKRVKEKMSSNQNFEPSKEGSIKRKKSPIQTLHPALLRGQDSNL